MALIACPDCQRPVSSHAAACPDCGYPLQVRPVSGVATIEQTGKRWKMAKILSAGCIISGFVIMAAFGPFGLPFLACGVAVGVYAVIGSWWHHG